MGSLVLTCFSGQGLADSWRAAKKDDDALAYIIVRLALTRSFLYHLTLLLNEVVKFPFTTSGSICERKHKILFSWWKHKVLERRFIPTRILDVLNVELAYR
jgi:hypothetical protein